MEAATAEHITIVVCTISDAGFTIQYMVANKDGTITIDMTMSEGTNDSFNCSIPDLLFFIT